MDLCKEKIGIILFLLYETETIQEMRFHTGISLRNVLRKAVTTLNLPPIIFKKRRVHFGFFFFVYVKGRE